jgi:hypothetical protein
MNLVLPEPVRQWVEAQAARAGQPPEAFVLGVLCERLQRDPFGEEDEYDEPKESNGQPPTAEDIANAKRILAAKLREALDSGPATPMTREDWDELRKRVSERLAQERAK